MCMKKKPSLDEFLTALNKLCEQHSVYMTGRMRIIPDTDPYDLTTFCITKKDVIDYSYARDTAGPFLEFAISEKPLSYVPKVYQRECVTIMDREKLMNGGFISMADGKVYTQRASYDDSLRRNDCILVGDDAKSHKIKTPEYDKIIDKQTLSEAYDKVAAKRNL